MENKFHKIEYYLNLLKKDYEKIDIEGVDIIGKFEKYLKVRERKNYISFKIKYAFLSVAIFLFLLNLYILFTKSHFNNEVKNLVEISKEEKNFIAKIDSVKKVNIVPLKDKGKKEVKKLETGKDIKINNTGDRIPIVETIEFTDEIRKIVELFKFDLNMEAENVEI